MSTIESLADAPVVDRGGARHLVRQRGVPLALRAAQILSVLLALPMTAGSVMFAVITPNHRYAAWVTWIFSPIAFAAGLGLLATAPMLARGRAPCGGE